MNTANLRRLLGEAPPRPWCWAHIYDGENVIQGEPSEHVAIVETEADTGLIVELVNNADELLAENERLKSLLAMCDELVREEADTRDCDCDYCEAVAALEKKQ